MTELGVSPAQTETLLPPTDLEARLEEFRVELTGYCYRMLGSAFDAEDAVQETLLRAWRSYQGFEGRASLRSWLYRIATNVCLDMLNGSKKRAQPMDMGPASSADNLLGDALPENAWIEPIPDGRASRPVTRQTSPSPASRFAWRSSRLSSACRRASAPC